MGVITYTTPDGHKCRDSKLNGSKYHKEVMEYEFRIRQEICCRNAGSAARETFAGRNGYPRRSRDGEELGGNDRVAENADQNPGRDSGVPGHPDNGRTDAGIHGKATQACW